MKLRGRSNTSDRRRGRTLSPAARGTRQTAHHGTLHQLLGSTSAFRSPECNILETRQSLRIRHHAMLHIKVPGCWEICNDFCGRAGTTFFNRRIRWPVILKSDANELRTRIQLNRCLTELRVHRSKQCALKRQEELGTVWNGVHVLPNGEVEGPAEASGRAQVERSSLDASAAAGRATRAHTVFPRPRRLTTGASRPPPTIVRRPA